MMTLRALIAGCVAAVLLAGTVPAQAEKKELTYVKTGNRSLSKSAITLSESPNHEVSQELLLQTSKYNDAEFSPTEEWIYIHTDAVDGTGTHKGYYFFTHKNGDQTYGDFEGRQKTVANQDGSWVSTWEGTYRYLGGTGKYRSIKGSGTYEGKVGSKEPFKETGRERIEY
jgi:hypothetical protein